MRYELPEEALVLRVLASPGCLSVRLLSEWTVVRLLAWVAQGGGGSGLSADGGGAAATPFNALIDVGALVTGLSNLEVAAALLALGLPHCDACVFIDKRGDKQVLLRPQAGEQGLNDDGGGDGGAGAGSLLLDGGDDADDDDGGGRLATVALVQQPPLPSTLAELRALPAFRALASAPTTVRARERAREGGPGALCASAARSVPFWLSARRRYPHRRRGRSGLHFGRGSGQADEPT